MDLQPFDLSRALTGSKVVTSDGSQVRIITHNISGKFCIAAAVTQANDTELVYQYDADGKCILGGSVSPLYLIPEYRTYYLVSYQKSKTNPNDIGGFVCNSSKEAHEFIAKNMTNPNIAFYKPAVSEIVRMV